MKRARVVQVLESELSLRHLPQFAAINPTPVQQLESGGVIWGTAPEGVLQGRPDSWVWYVRHKLQEQAEEIVNDARGLAELLSSHPYIHHFY